VALHPQTGKKERVFVDLEAVYPTPEEAGTELSFEEIWAQNRGWMEIDWGAIDAEDAHHQTEARQQPDGEEEDVRMDIDVDMDRDRYKDMDPADNFAEPVPISPDPPRPPVQKLIVRQDTIRLGDSIDLGQAKPRKNGKLATEQYNSPRRSQQRAPMQPRTQPLPQKISIRQDENGLLLDENGALMEQLKGDRPKKKKVMEINETQISECG